ncbi:hypothetical protein BpHYR1_000119, partial [Brachionus plicatilis]
VKKLNHHLSDEYICVTTLSNETSLAIVHILKESVRICWTFISIIQELNGIVFTEFFSSEIFSINPETYSNSSK